MAIKALSTFYYSIKNFASNQKQRINLYFKNRKADKLQKAAARKLPRPSDSPLPPRPSTDIHLRATRASTSMSHTSGLTQERPLSGSRTLLSEYTPGGPRFTEVIKKAGISSLENVDSRLLSDYADRVNSHFPLRGGENLESLLDDALQSLVGEIKAKQLLEMPPTQPAVKTTKPATPQRKPSGQWVDASGQKSIQSSQPKVIETIELEDGEVEYKSFDQTLPAAEAAINWLHVNRYYNRVDFDKVAEDMIRQSAEAVERYTGKSRHVAQIVHHFCQNRNWDGLMAYAHNLRDNHLVPFNRLIMGEINIRLFQDSLCHALEYKMQHNPGAREAYQEALLHASKPDWNSLATCFLLRTQQFGSDFVPVYCFEQLERVIPGYKVPRPDDHQHTASATVSPVAYTSPVSAFNQFGAHLPPHVTPAHLREKVTRPGIMGRDGQAAYQRLQHGVSNDDFYSIAEGMTYLTEDQKQPVTDPATYRAVRYRMIKERAVAHLSEKVSREDKPGMRALLEKAIDLINKNQWSKLATYDQDFHRHKDSPLFTQFLIDEIQQYNQLPRQ